MTLGHCREGDRERTAPSSLTLTVTLCHCREGDRESTAPASLTLTVTLGHCREGDRESAVSYWTIPKVTCGIKKRNPYHFRSDPHSNHMTSSKLADTLICHTTMCRNPINFIIYNPGHVTLWCVEVVLVANAREGSTQEHDWARVGRTLFLPTPTRLNKVKVLSHTSAYIPFICVHHSWFTFIMFNFKCYREEWYYTQKLISKTFY